MNTINPAAMLSDADIWALKPIQSPARVNTTLCVINPLNRLECALVARRVENGRLTPEEEAQLAEVYRQLEAEGALAEPGEVRELHNNHKANCRG